MELKSLKIRFNKGNTSVSFSTFLSNMQLKNPEIFNFRNFE